MLISVFFPKRALAVHSLIFCSDSASFTELVSDETVGPFSIRPALHAIIHSLTVHFPAVQKTSSALQVSRAGKMQQRLYTDIFI